MSIQRFFTRKNIIKREKDTVGNKRAHSTTATVDGHFEDLDAEAGRMLGIIDQRAWKFWFRLDEDLQIGDVIVDEDGNEYYVRAVTSKQLGINQHLEVLAVEHNA